MPDARPDDYHAIRREVLGLVGRINAAFPDAVIFEEHTEISCCDRLVRRPRCALETPGPRCLRGANGQGRRANGAPGVPMRPLALLSSRAPRRRRCTA